MMVGMERSGPPAHLATFMKSSSNHRTSQRFRVPLRRKQGVSSYDSYRQRLVRIFINSFYGSSSLFYKLALAVQHNGAGPMIVT